MSSSRGLNALLTNSIWVVPLCTLKAYLIVNNETKEVSDQTVWKINKYDSGYFFGTSYTTIDGVPSSKMSFVGSITPCNDVLMSFYSGSNTITGIGKFVKIDGEYQFIMQMNNLTNLAQQTIGVSHWSYMKSITLKSYEYRHLPGVGLSVPEFILLFS